MKLAIIPARGGSIRVPRKNIRPFFGKPMIAYPIAAAWRSEIVDEIVVSTDDDEIATIARAERCQVAWREPDDGATGTQEIARRVLLDWPEAITACVIYPCCPMLTPSDILAAKQLHGTFVDYVVTSYPDRIQDCGWLYYGWADAFRQGKPLVSAKTRLLPINAERCIDINTIDDWCKAEEMFTALRRANEDR